MFKLMSAWLCMQDGSSHVHSQAVRHIRYVLMSVLATGATPLHTFADGVRNANLQIGSKFSLWQGRTPKHMLWLVSMRSFFKQPEFWNASCHIFSVALLQSCR